MRFKTSSFFPILLISIPLFLIFATSCKKLIESPVDNCCDTAPLVDTIGLASIFIPNVFTPDQNGINDNFFIFSNGMVRSIKLMQIFNSNGIKVFENENFDNFYHGWDGKSFGTEIPGLFSYRIIIESIDNVIKTVEGRICALPCLDPSRKYKTFEHIDNCIFGLQHDGTGNYNPNFSNGEFFNCLE